MADHLQKEDATGNIALEDLSGAILLEFAGPFGTFTKDFPNPQTLLRTNTNRSWLWNGTLLLPVAPVQAPFGLKDWANPRVRLALTQTVTGSYTLALIGQDVLPPRQSTWPNPFGRTQPALSWLQSLVTTTLAVVAQAPFAFLDWVNPRGFRQQPQRSETSYLLPLIGQDALPFSQADWPVPKGPAALTNLRTWISDTIRFTLPGQDSLPFRLSDWPLPNRLAVHLRGWLDTYKLPLIGADALPFRLSEWPNPLRARSIDALTWLQSLVTTTLAVIVQSPFAQLDWPNPLIKGRAQVGFAASYLLSLIGADALPFRLSEWPLPNRLAVHLRGWVDAFKLPLIGTDFLPFRQLTWTNPLRPFQPALSWLQSLVHILSIGPAPFAQLQWPNPQLPRRATDLLTWTAAYLQTLIGKDVLPPRLSDWPNPLVKRHSHQGFIASFLRTLIGADALPFRQRDWPLPVRKAEQLRGFVAQAFQALSFVVLPFRQVDWPLPLRWSQVRFRLPFLPQFRPPTTITTVTNARMVAVQTAYPFAYVSTVNCAEAENLTVEWSWKIASGNSTLYSSGLRVTQTVGEGIIASTSVTVRVTHVVTEVITHA